MTPKLITLECPKCGATLEGNDGLETYCCNYCGYKILYTGQTKASIRAKVQIQEMKHKERIHQENLSQERYKMDVAQKEKKFQSKFELLSQLTPIILLFVVAFMCFVFANYFSFQHEKHISDLRHLESEIETDIEEKRFDEALAKTGQLNLSSSWSSEDKNWWEERRLYYEALIKEQKREEDIKKPTTVFVPQSSDDFRKFTESEAVDVFRKSGFNNVRCVEVSGKAGFFKKKHLVEHINIGGQTEFTTDDYFDKNAKVIIYYYAK